MGLAKKVGNNTLKGKVADDNNFNLLHCRQCAYRTKHKRSELK